MSNDNQTPNLPEQPQPQPQQQPSYGQYPGSPPVYGQQPTVSAPGQPPYGQGQPPHPQPARKTNTLAIVSLISSFFVTLVGIVTGHIALSQIKRTGEAGRGMAIAGLIIGYVLTGLYLLLAVAILLLSLFGLGIFGALVGSTISDTSPSSSTGDSSGGDEIIRSAPAAQGVVGAAYFVEGYIKLGNGPVIVDYFFDPMCPYCAVFHETNGFALDLGVSFDEITLRMHPLTFLDPQSQGTAYSSRAGSAVACVAALDEDELDFYVEDLFLNQPAEGTAGLTSTELAELWSGINADAAACIEADSYVEWAQTVNADALSGATSAKLGLPAVTGTPAVFVDGKQYTGALDDAAEFEAFLAGE